MCTYYYNVVGVYNILANNQSSVTVALLQGARGEFTATSNGNKHNGNNQKPAAKKNNNKYTRKKKSTHSWT